MTDGLTIVQITSRYEPCFHWLFESLHSQLRDSDKVSVILVDKWKANRPKIEPHGIPFLHVEHMPTIWQGATRLSKNDRWDASAYRNTGICYCKTKWIAFLDDRCVLMPHWMRGARWAMRDGYAVCGAYEKGHDLVVQNGYLVSYKETDGKDCRHSQVPDDNAYPCPGNWSFGCSFMAPLEWMLKINGWDQGMCGGASCEDVYAGRMIQNNGWPICYNRSMKVFQDRTPGQTGPDMLRTDKGPIGTPEDKSHHIQYALFDAKRTTNDYEISELREKILAGGEFPVPKSPLYDWFDGEKISEM